MSAPKPPDPEKTAAAQAQMNKETAITQSLLGMTNQTTPFGSLTWNQIGNWSDSQPQTQTQQTPAAPTPPSAADTGVLFGGMRREQAGGNTSAGWGTSSPTSATGGGANTGSDQNGDLYNVPRFEAVQTLTPELQLIVDNFLSTGGALSGRLKDTLGKPIDLSGLPGRVNSVSLRDVGTSLGFNGPDQLYSYGGDNPIQMSVGPQDWSEDRQRVEDALMSRLNPQLERDRSSREADLRARGIAPGSGIAYDSAVDELNRQGTDARMAAILAGGQEQSRLAGLDLAQGQFANSAQQQAYQQALERAGFHNQAQQVAFAQNALGKEFERSGIGINNQNELTRANFQNSARGAGLEELFSLRQMPINEIAALLSGTQIAGPKFTQTPQPGVNGVDYTSLVNQEYQAKLASHQGMMDGMFGLGKTLLGAIPFGSDRRLKEDIKPVGKLDNGLTVYSFRYKGEPGTIIGLMADEVKEIHPEAVVTHPSGFDMVYYDRAVL